MTRSSKPVSGFARPTILGYRFPSSACLPMLVLAVAVPLGCCGCAERESPAVAIDSPAIPTDDPLREVLELASSGETDAAIERFVSDAPDNWVESTSMETFQLSEPEFGALDRGEKSRLQQKFIDRVQEIKGFARTVVDRAREAKENGDEETANGYLAAVNRLGEQMRDANVVLVFQQTGRALADVTLDE